MSEPAVKSLKGVQVLVTRPAHQQSEFIQLLTRCGAKPISLPCLNIESNAAEAQASLAKLHLVDVIIFTSVNAVNFALEAKPPPWSIGNADILAVGPKTAKRLAQLGLPVTVAPQTPYNSEALLQLAPLRAQSLQKVALIKGIGGRTKLAEALKKTGTSVDNIDVYRRIRPSYTHEELQSVFLNSGPDIITTTSNESLQNLVDLTGGRFATQLLNLPLVVNSQRGAQLANDLGFQSDVLIAPEPGDLGQFDAIKLWNQSYRFKI